MEQSVLDWIDSQQDEMLRLITRWSEINSGTSNLSGLASMAAVLDAEFASLGGKMQRIDLNPATTIDSTGNAVPHPLGQAISIRKDSLSPLRVLLNIHYDTVFGHDHPFGRVTRSGDDTLTGPGVADAKGGIVVMLTVLRALEQSNLAEEIAWEILLNPDEEIGSPGSAPLLIDAAKRNAFGLVFEPAMSDGALVDSRKGAGGFTVIARGRSAHAGRDFTQGRSAVLALAEFINKIDIAAKDHPGVIVNCGRIEGGGATNIVPDLAIGRFNVRAATREDQRIIEDLIARIAHDVGRRDGITLSIHGGFTSPPKPLDARSQILLDQIIFCGRELKLELTHRPSGGTSDGNKLAAAGLPVIDSLGPVGGELHSDREFIRISSLTQRAKLVALLLMKHASGELPTP